MTAVKRQNTQRRGKAKRAPQNITDSGLWLEVCRKEGGREGGRERERRERERERRERERREREREGEREKDRVRGERGSYFKCI